MQISSMKSSQWIDITMRLDDIDASAIMKDAAHILNIADTLQVVKVGNLRPIYLIYDLVESHVLKNNNHIYAILPKHFNGLPVKVTRSKYIHVPKLPYKLYSPEELIQQITPPYKYDLMALMEMKKAIPPKYPKLFVVRNSPDIHKYIYNTQTITFTEA